MGRSYASGYGNESVIPVGVIFFSIINNRWNNKGPFNAEAPSGSEPTATTALDGVVYHPEIASSEWRHPKCCTCNMNTMVQGRPRGYGRVTQKLEFPSLGALSLKGHHFQLERVATSKAFF